MTEQKQKYEVRVIRPPLKMIIIDKDKVELIVSGSYVTIRKTLMRIKRDNSI